VLFQQLLHGILIEMLVESPWQNC